MGKKLRLYFISGLLVLIPLAVTIFILRWLVRLADSIFTWLPENINPLYYIGLWLHVDPKNLYGAGLILLIIAIPIVGMLTAGIMGRYFLHLWQRIIEKIPFVGSIHATTRDVLDTLVHQNKRAFRQAVLIPFGGEHQYVVGLVTNERSKFYDFLKEKGKTVEPKVLGLKEEGDTVLSVFVPTTPNPTSGYLFFIPSSKVIYLDIPVEQAIKLIISAGVVVPGDKKVT